MSDDAADLLPRLDVLQGVLVQEEQGHLSVVALRVTDLVPRPGQLEGGRGDDGADGSVLAASDVGDLEAV